MALKKWERKSKTKKRKRGVGGFCPFFSSKFNLLIIFDFTCIFYFLDSPWKKINCCFVLLVATGSYKI